MKKWYIIAQVKHEGLELPVDAMAGHFTDRNMATDFAIHLQQSYPGVNFFLVNKG